MKQKYQAKYIYISPEKRQHILDELKLDAKVTLMMQNLMNLIMLLNK